MNNAAIKSIVDSPAWSDVVGFIGEQFRGEIDTDGLSVEEIGQRYLALQVARDRFTDAVGKLYAIADQEKRETIKYK